MAEIVNLNKARKQRKRAEAAGQAAANRVKHGRTGSERARAAAETARVARAYGGNELAREAPDDPDTTPPSSGKR